jgi:hypothetical protein
MGLKRGISARGNRLRHLTRVAPGHRVGRVAQHLLHWTRLNLVDTHNEEGRQALAGVRVVSRARRTFTSEFKAETVELIRTSGKSVGEVCRDLDLTETAVRG